MVDKINQLLAEKKEELEKAFKLAGIELKCEILSKLDLIVELQEGIAKIVEGEEETK